MVKRVLNYTEDGYTVGDVFQQKLFLHNPELILSNKWDSFWDEDEPSALADCGDQ